MTEKQPLTDRQQAVLDFLNNFVLRKGWHPTLRELADGIGVKSQNAALKHLEALERKGYIKRQRGSARAITFL